MTKRVLLIEDEPNIIAAVSFILTRGGWDVKTHSNGHDAIEAIQNHMPDMIILDVMLPGRSGFDILHDIRRQSDIPVLMLTARGQEKDRETATRIGASRFMTKPFANDALLATVREMVPE